ncbi:hypothetical protein J5N97_006721 [Dioscorea zingiberensis]|uniref:PUM-HD domain-containing protein n=1 Tax=Dioscorea zingiberensis TaxID=325984 RepID=A0A9D5HSZ6_9LILI|nr:hypothetical protein J5N97_006721 [Dioscorea zingiberensis]
MTLWGDLISRNGKEIEEVVDKRPVLMATSVKIDNFKGNNLTYNDITYVKNLYICYGEGVPIKSHPSNLFADGLILEKTSCPLGVLLIVFESQPVALVQVASLAVRSGNGLLKGGKEAMRSNVILPIPSTVGEKLIGLVTSRDEILDLLKLDDVIYLVIPRGSNKLVTQIQESTKITILGHVAKITRCCFVYDGPRASTELKIFDFVITPKSAQVKYNSIDDVMGKVYTMAKYQIGCRFLQKKFTEGDPKDIEKIFGEIISYIVELMNDPFRNYLVQKLLEVCNEDQRMCILCAVTGKTGELFRISCDMHGFALPICYDVLLLFMGMQVCLVNVTGE